MERALLVKLTVNWQDYEDVSDGLILAYAIPEENITEGAKFSLATKSDVEKLKPEVRID